MKAGVFDSGVGGLTVVKSLLENQTFEEILYYGD
ncbi:MAG: glutamate racemase, partial [Epsilonproteobacteria bacterium]